MSEKILFVDDDPNFLAACRRTLRWHFQVETAGGGEAGLAKLASHGPFAVVVADRQMPGMDGIEFLGAVRKSVPDVIRIMLTGNADLEGAIRVVNEGNIFRFLTKPCPPEVLIQILQDALAQHRLVTAEKELLNKTLNGSIKLLTDILSMVDHHSFGRAQTLRNTVTAMTARLHVENAWEIHLAVMLASIGYVTIPPETLVKARAGLALSAVEDLMLAHLPETAARLLANIPRLEGVARIVQYHHKHFDGSGFPADGGAGESIPLGSRLLKILSDLMDLQSAGLSRVKALEKLQTRSGWYDPALLTAVRACSEGELGNAVNASDLSLSVRFLDLVPGMVLRSNVETRDGTLILSVGHQINEMTLEKLRNFERVVGLKEPILVENTGPPPNAEPAV